MEESLVFTIEQTLSWHEFESHLRCFEFAMPPHGGFAIGAERLTAQILKLSNIREATLYPRDRNRLSP
jgi:nondiscriminating aspartyl-tRNA synthetase